MGKFDLQSNMLKNVHKFCFQEILMTFTCDLKIDPIMSN